MPCAEQRVRFPRRGGSPKPPHPSEPCVLPCAKGSNPPGKPSSDRSAVFPSHASSSGCSASSVKVENVILLPVRIVFQVRFAPFSCSSSSCKSHSRFPAAQQKNFDGKLSAHAARTPLSVSSPVLIACSASSLRSFGLIGFFSVSYTALSASIG